MKNKSYFVIAGLFIVAFLAAFAPPGVTFSKEGYAYPALPTATESSSTDALYDTGEGPTDDGSLAATNVVTGFYVFDVHETTGIELHFAMEGATGVTGTARVWRAIPIMGSQFPSTNGTVTQWTYRHLCDVSLTASAQEGSAAGFVKSTHRWASVVVTADAGLSPLGSRAMNGLTTNAAGSLVIDPMCAPRIVVQVRRATASSIVPLALDWTRN